MSELTAAIEAYQRRKESAIGEDYEPQTAPLDQLRTILVGFELDAQEVANVAHKLIGQTTVQAALSHGIDPVTAFAGVWVEGLATGLLLADTRQREQAKEPAE